MDASGLMGELADALAAGGRAGLALVADRSGSAPRGPGAALLLRPDGVVLGSVGGGAVESAALRALSGLAPGGAAVLDFDLDAAEAARSGLVCGGRVRILVLVPEPEAGPVFAALAGELAAGRPVLALAALGVDPSGRLRAGTPCLLDGQGRVLAGSLPPGGPEAADALSGDVPRLVARGGGFLLAWPFRPGPPLYLFGAGHVARQTAALAARTGFRVLVFDDRAEFADPQRFPEAAAVTVLPDLSASLAGLGVGPEAFVLIMTRGHEHDFSVLARMLATPARFVGMIGSRRKREHLFRSLVEQGVPAADLDRVVCPVGLPIGAEGPEEIAVSVVAQLVAVRRGA